MGLATRCETDRREKQEEQEGRTTAPTKPTKQPSETTQQQPKETKSDQTARFPARSVLNIVENSPRAHPCRTKAVQRDRKMRLSARKSKPPSYRHLLNVNLRRYPLTSVSGATKPSNAGLPRLNSRSSIARSQEKPGQGPTFPAGRVGRTCPMVVSQWGLQPSKQLSAVCRTSPGHPIVISQWGQP